MAKNLEELAVQLSAFNTADLAAGIGALQLMPSNAERQLRFEVVASIIAALPPNNELTSMSVSRWRQLMNEPPIGDRMRVSAEDPAEGAFTASLSFTGGPAVVFRGIVAESTEICRHLLRAVFLHPELPREFKEEIKPLIFAGLRLSDTLAKRAELGRGVPPRSAFDNQVEVPQATQFSALKRAVTFTQEDLQTILGDHTEECLRPLVLNAGDSGPYTASQEMGASHLYIKPILRVGDRYFVVLPSGILVALRHRLISRALQLNIGSTLAQNFQLSVSREIHKSLEMMRFVREPVKLKDEPAWANETVWSFDIDKLAHVLLITDDFSEYTEDEVFAHWKPAWGDQVEPRLLKVRELLRSMAAELEGILHVVVMQSAGRMMTLGLTPNIRDPQAHIILTSQPDLEIIARLEALDPVALWKFSQARSRLHDKTRIFHLGGALDEYALYRAKGHSFYLSDQAMPNFLHIASDVATKLRLDDISNFDFHGVLSWDETIVEVQRLFPESLVPIYTRDPATFDYIEFLVDGLPLPVWVFEHRRDSHDQKLLYFEICEAIAYWIWQMSQALSGLIACAVKHIDQICFEVHLEPSENWTQLQDGLETTGWLETANHGNGFVKINFGDRAPLALSGANNAGERELAKAILDAFKEVIEEVTGLKTVLDASAAIDIYAPLGPKKKIISIDTSKNVRLTPGDLPPCRFVQDADVEALLDDIGPQIATTLQLATGHISSNQRVDVVNHTVSILFSWLEASVSELSATGLLERLIAQHESLVRESAHSRLVVPTRLACFGTDGNYVEKLKERSQNIVRTNLANRFLIEYVAAIPPQGTQRLSIAMFDHLMALASEIIQKGMLSDAIRYGLADTELSILPSGRLGMNREGRYVKGVEEFAEVRNMQETEAAKSWFERHWTESITPEEEPVDAELESAVQAEFGVNITELMQLLLEAEGIGLESRNEPTVMLLENMIYTLQDSLSLKPDKIRTVLETFTLRPRASFILKDLGPEIYPWRFNRDLSYVRRPFVIRIAEGREEVLWGFRHLEECGQNLLRLIFNCRLKARTQEMKAFMSRVKNRESEAFNDAVADIFAERGLVVRRRVDKIGSLRIEDVPGEPLGDIDVLVADSKGRRLLAVETKDFELARTPFELSNEVEKLFFGNHSAVARHEKRAKWLERHVREVCEWLGVTQGRSKWRVEALIVISRSLMSPYIKKSPIRVLPVESLTDSDI